ncbi:MAG: glucosamine-6-phosphate deaminase [Coriobacteriia bacterium]|nr:glucosamine-6-phosphate deaminase [Coriobacteriia bacterium]
MKIIPTQTKDDMASAAAEIFAEQISTKPDSVLGLATGETPRELYKSLIEKHDAGDLDFSKISSFNLDEYVGLPKDHDQSYNWYMRDALFNHVNIADDNWHVPDGTATDLEAEGRAYDERIKEYGGVDLQLLGIGVNGHIAFNEPDSSFPLGTHPVDLTPSTIEVNSQYFATPEEMPTKALTMGIGSIFNADRIVLIASGPSKADILYDAFFGPVTPKIPASILQMHKDVTLIADEEALRVIREKGAL